MMTIRNIQLQHIKGEITLGHITYVTNISLSPEAQAVFCNSINYAM